MVVIARIHANGCFMFVVQITLYERINNTIETIDIADI